MIDGLEQWGTGETSLPFEELWTDDRHRPYRCIQKTRHMLLETMWEVRIFLAKESGVTAEPIYFQSSEERDYEAHAVR